MRDIDARVTGFNYTTYHAYTTEVEVDGHTWMLSIRYNTFYQFYERLLAIEKYFSVDFPPKGNLFFSPSPEERQEELDEFMLSTLAYFDMRDHPKRMGALLDELLKISKHLVVKDEEKEEERTASEGSFDVIDDFLESGYDISQRIVADENQVKAVVKLDSQGLKAENEDEVQAHDTVKINLVELETKTKAVESKAAKLEKSTDVQLSVKQDKVMEVEVEMQQKKAAVAKVEEKPATPMIEKNTVPHGKPADAIPTQAASETTAPSLESEEDALESVAPIEGDYENASDTTIKLHAVSILGSKSEAKMVKENEPFSQEESQEPDLESWKEDTESENPVVGWFRRIITFGSSPGEKEEQEAVQKQYEEEDEQRDQGEQEAAAQAETEAEEAEAEEAEAAEAEACTKAEEEAKVEAMEAELLLAALNLRLKRYRHPVFFRNFNCDVKASRFFMPQRLSSGILV
ncbi:unnamed protein product [Peronospora destructor]|uniref:PX domain-containing protein n=1 Tax=Peronospora destructor TaxID=86335 RepID=A0AAV0TW49_9STRA|nr:unnamed protein product [Peronospora destructor]